MLTERNLGIIVHIELDPNNRSHLKGRYKETLLVAAAHDANMQIYSIAWGVKNSIKRAITMLFPLLHHGTCIWYIKKNLIARYSSRNVIFLFKSAAFAYRVSEFQQMMRQIRTIWPTVVSYLECAGPSTWSQANFVGNRYNIMANNIAESLNSVFRQQQSFPITSFVQHITTLMQQWFFKRRNASTNCHTAMTSKMKGELRQSFDVGATLDIRNLDKLVFEVGTGAEICTIDLVASYTELLYPVGMELDWVVPNAISSINILPPNTCIAPGRPPTQRRRSRTAWSTSTRKCGQCGGSGHNMQTCRNSTRRSNTCT
ncbi:uncharacterized protein LOC111373462 [Olea europaea var. sylvestris]|uniref:uncharacterized protein LOC111373462 n=1 Tax=Olea europaea var. sylvestris TaxID=158386 RepID=UPI000C1D50B7|nr:uncharacterized protein LOC111373462 [Olea europaea var. sylvestris]